MSCKQSLDERNVIYRLRFLGKSQAEIADPGLGRGECRDTPFAGKANPCRMGAWHCRRARAGPAERAASRVPARPASREGDV